MIKCPVKWLDIAHPASVEGPKKGENFIRHKGLNEPQRNKLLKHEHNLLDFILQKIESPLDHKRKKVNVSGVNNYEPIPSKLAEIKM